MDYKAGGLDMRHRRTLATWASASTVLVDIGTEKTAVAPAPLPFLPHNLPRERRQASDPRAKS